MKAVTIYLPEQSDFNLSGEEKAEMWKKVNGSWQRPNSTFVDMGLCLRVIGQAIGQMKNSLNSPFNQVRSERDNAFASVYKALLSDVTDISEAAYSINRYENGGYTGTLNDFISYVSSKKADNNTTAARTTIAEPPAQHKSSDEGKVDQPLAGQSNRVLKALALLEAFEKDEAAEQTAEREAAAQAAREMLEQASLRTGRRAA